MIVWSPRRIVAVFRDPFWFRILSRRAIEASPTFVLMLAVFVLVLMLVVKETLHYVINAGRPLL